MRRMSKEVRPWVERLAMYLFIFGKPTSHTDDRYLESLITMAKKREANSSGGAT